MKNPEPVKDAHFFQGKRMAKEAVESKTIEQLYSWVGGIKEGISENTPKEAKIWPEDPRRNSPRDAKTFAPIDPKNQHPAEC